MKGGDGGFVAGEDIAPHLREKADIFRFKGEALLQMTDDVAKEFVAAKRELEKECLREKLLALGEEIKRIERGGGREGLQPLLVDFMALSEKLKILS